MGECAVLSIQASQVRTLKSFVGTRGLKVGFTSVREAIADGLGEARRSGVWRQGGYTVPL